VRQAFLNQVDAGGLQRLEKAACESERNAILVPEFLAAAGAEPQETRLGLRLAVEIGQQRSGRLVRR